MDALSRLLKLYPMRTALEIHCQVGAPWVLDYPAAEKGTAPYHMVVAGTALADHEGGRVALETGDVIVFPHASAHRLHVGEPGSGKPLRHLGMAAPLLEVGNGGDGAPTELLCGHFYFQDGAMNALLASLPPRMVVRTAQRADCAGLRALIGMLQSEAHSVRPGTEAVLSHLSSALFSLLVRAWLEQAAATQGLFALLAEARLQPTLQCMLETPGQAWTLDSMAEASHMSRATFARLFQQVAGTTPAAMLMETRMAHAAHALASSGRAVADIGETVGYQSEAAFNRVFKKRYGMGPGQYRRQARASA
ncbi:AraC family transcriptional regulator [Massilia sp. CF038]|uniref:AraC family transcriptional regulator n=1 Tax=Massilia sp. CF038 TaxID=1881045 RepID=UPI000913E28B|nr:AraC family transcriptional regulator [Massilia sp. CF038]SHG65084.1 transcriptional regulator, AraC family [Massilia sp. CF038]